MRRLANLFWGPPAAVSGSLLLVTYTSYTSSSTSFSQSTLAGKSSLAPAPSRFTSRRLPSLSLSWPCTYSFCSSIPETESNTNATMNDVNDYKNSNSKSSSNSNSANIKIVGDWDAGNNDQSLLPKKPKKKVFIEILGIDGSIKRLETIMSTTISTTITDQISASAVDSIKESERAVNEIAKTLVREVLDTSQHYGTFGIFLQNLFKHDVVSSYVRWLVYWPLATDYSVQYAYDIFKSQIEFYLTVHKFNYPPSDPNYTAHSHMPLTILIRSANWWLHEESTRRDVLVPTIAWLMEQEDDVITPLADVLASIRPRLEQPCVDTIVYYLLDYLKSNEAKKAAKNGVIAAFKKVGERTEHPSGKS